MQHVLSVSRHDKNEVKIKFDSSKYIYRVNRESGDEFHHLILTKEQAIEVANALLDVEKRIPEQPPRRYPGKVSVE